MKSVLALLAVIVAAASASEDLSSFIVNGEDASIHQYPYMAGVFNFGWPSCGGSIISARSVLTAAHCILVPGPFVSVSVGGSRRWGQDGTRYRSLRVITHPDYRYVEEPFELENDVAVIRTLRGIEFGPTVQIIPLGVSQVPAGQVITATGWGLMGDVS